MLETIMITGGAGFIGSAVTRYAIQHTSLRMVVVDKLTYAGNLDSLDAVKDDPRYSFFRVDICDSRMMRSLIERVQPDAIMHLAAETHVDKSIDGPALFIQTNVVGTFTLLQVAHDYWCELPPARRASFRFHHVSTDEVFGSLGSTGRFHEGTPYKPNSPYSASKAASDHLVRAWHHTYGFPTVTSNCSNNYGPYQFPEKLIPLTILNAIEGKPIPVYGNGENVRDWLYVEDHARALLEVTQRGTAGETYNVGGYSERANIDVVRAICALVDDFEGAHLTGPREQLITFVHDRPGHDFRYAIDASKIARELGWYPAETFDSGLRKTVAWYIGNRLWWDRLKRAPTIV